MAHDDVAASPLGSTEGFESVWNHVAEKLLTSYTDEPFVSDDYGRELSGARTQAIEVEQVTTIPPERIGAWLGTVATTALRALDLTLVLDLLRIEQDDERWGELMTPVVALLEDLLLVGDFDAADAAGRRCWSAKPAPPATVDGAPPARDRPRSTCWSPGSMMRHIVDAPGDDRRGAVRAGEGDVRVARRGAGPAARRGAVGRRARRARASG